MVQKNAVKNVNKVVRDTASLISHLANCKGYWISFKPLHHTKYIVHAIILYHFKWHHCFKEKDTMVVLYYYYKFIIKKYIFCRPISSSKEEEVAW